MYLYNISRCYSDITKHRHYTGHQHDPDYRGSGGRYWYRDRDGDSDNGADGDGVLYGDRGDSGAALTLGDSRRRLCVVSPATTHTLA